MRRLSRTARLALSLSASLMACRPADEERGVGAPPDTLIEPIGIPERYDYLRIDSGTAVLDSTVLARIARESAFFVDRTLLADSRIGTTSSFALNLGDGASFDVVLTLRDQQAGRSVWAGELRDVPGSVLLVRSDAGLYGFIHVPDSVFEVREVFGELHAVRRVSWDAYIPESRIAEAAAGAPARRQPTCPRAIVDVLVAYTPAVLQTVGDDAAVKALAYAALSEANEALARSGLPHLFRYIDAIPTDYTLEGAIEADLARLTKTNDGHMDRLHTQRSQFGADMISVLVASTARSRVPGTCGLGHVNGMPHQRGDTLAFNIVNVGCLPYRTLAHELGHNLGLEHEREDPGNRPADDGGYGYRDPQDRFRSVMAIQCSPRAPHCPPFNRIGQYSNPSTTFLDSPVGIAYGRPDAADEAGTLRWTMCHAATWR